MEHKNVIFYELYQLRLIPLIVVVIATFSLITVNQTNSDHYNILIIYYWFARREQKQHSNNIVIIYDQESGQTKCVAKCVYFCL